MIEECDFGEAGDAVTNTAVRCCGGMANTLTKRTDRFKGSIMARCTVVNDTTVVKYRIGECQRQDGDAVAKAAILIRWNMRRGPGRFTRQRQDAAVMTTFATTGQARVHICNKRG